MTEYIEKAAFNYSIREAVKKYPNSFYNWIEVARQIAHEFPAADVVPGRDFRDCRNELCLRCGDYKQRHLGACDGCRWKEADNQQSGGLEDFPLLKEAAEAIEELSKPKWISVTERLPEAHEDVLLLFPNNQAAGFRDRDCCWKVYSGNGFYTEVAEYEIKPTHWAKKIPEPPKEES